MAPAAFRSPEFEGSSSMLEVSAMAIVGFCALVMATAFCSACCKKRRFKDAATQTPPELLSDYADPSTDEKRSAIESKQPPQSTLIKGKQSLPKPPQPSFVKKAASTQGNLSLPTPTTSAAGTALSTKSTQSFKKTLHYLDFAPLKKLKETKQFADKGQYETMAGVSPDALNKSAMEVKKFAGRADYGTMMSVPQDALNKSAKEVKKFAGRGEYGTMVFVPEDALSKSKKHA